MKKKIFAIMLAIITLTSITACGTTESSGISASDNSSITENTDLSEEVDTISEMEALEGFETLFSDALKCCAAGNSEKFATLFSEGTTQENIDSAYASLEEIANNGFPNEDYTILCGDGTYFMGLYYASMVSGSYPDTRSMNYSTTVCFSKTEGVWKIDTTEEAVQALNEDFLKIYPEECIAASNAGRNVVDFSNFNYSWVDTSIVNPGSLEGAVYLAWQNEDGSVDCLVNIKNGTSEIRAINSVEVILTDSAGNEILSIKSSGQNIAPNRSENYIISIPAEKVLTGTETWGAVGADCHIISD